MAQTLNGISCAAYNMLSKDSVKFSLMDTTVDEAAELNKADTLEVKDGETLVASFAGFRVISVDLATDGQSVRLVASRELAPETKEAIRALESNMQVVTTTANSAVSTAAEAKTIAEQAGTDPQVTAFAKMAVIPMAESMTIAEGASVSSLWPEKKVGDTVKLKDFFWYGGELYRCNQPDLTITAGQEPDKNLPALYGHVSVAPDGILIWDADDLTGAPDIYNTGVKVHYPDADGPVYVSGRDGNTSTPGTDQWWTLAEE